MSPLSARCGACVSVSSCPWKQGWLEIQSKNKFVAMARPAVLWIASSVIFINFGLVPIYNAISVASGGVQLVLVYPELPEKVYWLIGTIFGFYTGGRSFEKVKGRA